MEITLVLSHVEITLVLSHVEITLVLSPVEITLVLSHVENKIMVNHVLLLPSWTIIGWVLHRDRGWAKTDKQCFINLLFSCVEQYQ